MKLSQIEYRRPDIEAIKAEMSQVTERIRSAGSAESQAALYEEFCRISEHLQTYSSLAYIRFTQDTSDEFYRAEMDFFDAELPSVSEYGRQAACALLQSPFRKELETMLPPILFRNFECERDSFSPQVVQQLQEDNRLVTEYSRLLASAQIDFDGKTLNLPQLAKYRESPDPSVRRRAAVAQGQWLKSRADELDDIFDKLVKIRDLTAKKLGYSDYYEYSFPRLCRVGYGPSELASFRKQVVDTWVPFVCRLKAAQASALGLERVSYCDDTVWFARGNPEPVLAPEKMLEAGRDMYRRMSASAGEFMDFMLEHELFDVFARLNKSGGGYSTELPDFGMPFIFANFNGTYADVDVLTHEAGHAYASYEAMRNIPIRALRGAGMETCEVHSMSMEFFAWKYMDSFFADRADDYRYMHLANAVSFIPYGTMVDYFQQLVYKHVDMTPAERKDLWLQLERTFRPYMSMDGIPYIEDGGRWQCQAHIYENPFYYIDYCLAQSVAFDFLIASRQDYDSAFGRYVNFVKKGGTVSFDSLVTSAGFPSVFSPYSLGVIAARLAPMLGL